MTYAITRVHQTRFYLVTDSDGGKSAAIVNDWGDLVTVSLEVQQ